MDDHDRAQMAALGNHAARPGMNPHERARRAQLQAQAVQLQRDAMVASPDALLKACEMARDLVLRVKLTER